MEKSVHIIGSS